MFSKKKKSNLPAEPVSLAPPKFENSTPEMSFSFPQILELYEGPLLRYASRLLIYANAQPEDLVQDAFMKLHKKVKEDGWASITDIKNWMFRVTHNLCMDVLRREKTEKIYFDEQHVLVESQNHTTDMVEEQIIKEEYQKAIKVLDELEEKEKVVLTLKLLEGMKNIEIANILGDQESTVSYWLHKGLKSLAVKLKERELI